MKLSPSLIVELIMIAAPLSISVIEGFKLRKWHKIATTLITGVESSPIPDEHKTTVKETIEGISRLAGVAEKLHQEVKARTSKPILK